MCKLFTGFAIPVLVAMLLMLGSVGITVETALAQDEVTAAECVEGDVIIVLDGLLNLRDDASLSGQVVTVLSEGEYLDVLGGPYSGDGYFWDQVYSAIHDASGYVATDFVAEATAGFAAGDEVIVVDGPVNVGTGSGTNFLRHLANRRCRCSGFGTLLWSLRLVRGQS